MVIEPDESASNQRQGLLEGVTTSSQNGSVRQKSPPAESTASSPGVGKRSVVCDSSEYVGLGEEVDHEHAVVLDDAELASESSGKACSVQASSKKVVSFWVSADESARSRRKKLR